MGTNKAKTTKAKPRSKLFCCPKTGCPFSANGQKKLEIHLAVKHHKCEQCNFELVSPGKHVIDVHKGWPCRKAGCLFRTKHSQGARKVHEGVCKPKTTKTTKTPNKAKTPKAKPRSNLFCCPKTGCPYSAD